MFLFSESETLLQLLVRCVFDHSLWIQEADWYNHRGQLLVFGSNVTGQLGMGLNVQSASYLQPIFGLSDVVLAATNHALTI